MLDKIQAERRELEKERMRIRDERNEYKRLLRVQSRQESLRDLLLDTIEGYVPTGLNFDRQFYEYADNDLIVHLTDIHAGLFVSNYFNTYDLNILKERLSIYLNKVLDIQKRHRSENCFLVLGGDLISGIIHDNLRIENNINVIKQILFVSDLISDFTRILSQYFKLVTVYLTPGNHGRVFQNKENSIKGENFEMFVPAYLDVKLQNIENVIVKLENDIDETIGTFSIRGKTVYFSHGDKDSVKTIVSNLTLMLNKKPDIVLLGHRHTNGLTTICDTKIIESGCVCGSDSYCIDKRLYNAPEQMILVVSCDGLECLYDIQLNDKLQTIRKDKDEKN